MNVVIVEHLPQEPAAAIAEVLEQAGARTRIIDPKHQQLPACCDAAVIMGGPMSANDDLPWLKRELAWTAAQLERGTPMFGVCLGAQIMARAAGACIGPSPVRELGWYPVYPTAQAASDPLFRDWPRDGMHVFQWHGETFTLPEQATLLATHPEVPHQAFRLAPGQYGLQFHLEVEARIIDLWLHECEDEVAHLGIKGVRAIRRLTPAHAPCALRMCHRMIRAWHRMIEENIATT